jgi:hypothetical protein
MQMDIAGFFSALFSDWVGMMSGIASVILAIIGFVQKPRNQPHRFWTERWLFWAAVRLASFFGPLRQFSLAHPK